ncbi:FAD linked oxidase domain protein [Chthoniobacter flavus Ellin428]|uniref:FAD linked oxidase domain protein n=1 Tax=Chthoniobacter flavus Ellin428 TaxID=497964 RepID=B4CX92_9BACT|nr:FAD linked oxidase domain protein [Chthoniobacter flavus Ellin428]TCO85622.1 FAD/FMN-containing dehydrogenase [Chthoniobacter flavus]
MQTVNSPTAVRNGDPEVANPIDSPPVEVDVAQLEVELRAALAGEVRFSKGDRALYATDSSNYRQTPIGVIMPRDAGDVVSATEICRKYGAPILSRGTGTSLAGQTCNVAVIFDFSKYMRRIQWIDPEKRLARVEPGIPLDDINKATETHGLCFGPDPSTHAWCSIGGMIGNNSCGVHSVHAEFSGTGPRTSDNLEELEILTYDGLRMRVGPTSEAELESIIREGGRRGAIYAQLKALRDRYADLIRTRFPKLLRRGSGFNLDELLPEKGFNVARALAGTEGTCTLVLDATLQLISNPPMRALVMLGYPDIYLAAEDVMFARKFRPVGLEGIDDKFVDGMKKKHMHPEDLELFPPGKGWLLVEFGGETKEEADVKARAFIAASSARKDAPTSRLYDAPFKEEHIWEARESGLPASARVPNEPDTWEGWEDSAVPVENLAPYLREFRALLDKYGWLCTFYGHFGQGLVHTRIDFPLKTADGVRAYERFGREAAELVVKFGGSMSGEHGDGQSRAEFLNIMYGDELVEAFRQFKAIWDPANQMNPGKVAGPGHIYRRDENLRLGEHYDPPQVKTHFQFPDDKGSFSYALERCVGVGKCRRESAGTMCPSYMVTHDEKHCTRGRARSLFEMLQGKVIGRNGWRDDAVHEALDLCLSCKGCKSDCPMNVDMATYKAEFLSHYYEGRLRPLPAYAMGLIYWWARLASKVPTLVNFFTQTPPFSTLAKIFGGIAQQRQMPKFAAQTFREWFAQRQAPPRVGVRVVLWPDTFNNFFFPETLIAAVEVLEAAGCHVVLPPRMLCCGRPLYDFGMLTVAKKLLQDILESLGDEIDAGTPLIGLEPSCVAVFRDELHGMFPNREQAGRLQQQTFTLAEYLMKHAPGFEPPKLQRHALLHGHCHHKAIMKLTQEEKLLEKMGLEVDKPDTGCCGMAGSFGFEKEKYDVSVACGERVLLPAVRSASPDTLIIADGFSCREQIAQLTERRALHTAEVLKMALDSGPRGPVGVLPEQSGREPERAALNPLEVAILGGAALALVSTFISFLRGRRR